MPDAIPLLIALELLQHEDNDRMTHSVRLGVVGMPHPLEAEIVSDFYEWPRIGEIITHGDIDLPSRLQDLLIFKSFELVQNDLDGTPFSQIILPDATPWLEIQFLSHEAKILLAEFRRHLKPDQDIDLSRCDAFPFIPVQFPKHGAQDDPQR